MIKPILVFVTLAVLSGCDNEVKSPPKEQSGAASVVKPADTAVVANQLQLPDGSALSLGGSVPKQTSKPNDAGKLIINEAALGASSRKVEAEVYAELEKSGYSRKVVEEREGFLKVHYYKSSFPVVGGVYKDQEKDSNGQERSLVRLYWQES